MSNGFKTLDDLLYYYKCNEKGKETHTRIPYNSKKIYSGKYCIPLEVLPMFYKLYHKKVFLQKRNEYLTEKQLSDAGPILIDMDFRYDNTISERQHTEEHIEDIIELYIEKIREMVIWETDIAIPIFVLEKPNINATGPTIVKDGIHFIFGIQMKHTAQLILREKIKKEINNILEDLPLINDYDSVLDIGISKGTTNWQMYGSRKPGHEAYQLIKYYNANCNENQLVELEEVKNKAHQLSTLANISGHNTTLPQLELTEEIQKLSKLHKKICIKKPHIKNVSVQVQHNFAEISHG